MKVCIFHHDHGIRALGEHRAGVDANGRARDDGDGGNDAGRDVAGQFEVGGGLFGGTVGVGRAHGVAVHRRAGERRQRFLDDLLTGVPVQPVNVPIALRAGQIDGQSQAKGVRVPLSDLLIGASALELGYRVGTANMRHFQLIPGLNVIQL